MSGTAQQTFVSGQETLYGEIQGQQEVPRVTFTHMLQIHSGL